MSNEPEFEQKGPYDDLMAELNAMKGEEEESSNPEEAPKEEAIVEAEEYEAPLPDEELEIVAEVESDVEEEAPSYTEAEEKAMKMGWKPKDKYADDPDDYIEAEEYIARGPLIKHTKNQSKKIDKLEAGMKELMAELAKAREAGRQEALKELMLDKQAAYKVGNLTAAQELESKHDKLREEQLLEQQQKLQEESESSYEAPKQGLTAQDIIKHPAWASFQAKNAWVGSDKAEHISLRDKGALLADKYMSIVGESNFTEAHIPEMVKYIESELTPKVNDNPNRYKAPEVAKRSTANKATTSNSKRHPDWNNMSKAQQEVARTSCFGKDASMKLDEYINILKSNGSLRQS